MVTVNNILGENSGTAEMELKGLSTDTKPTGTFSGYNIGVNSLFIELDTGNIYYYTGSAWETMSTGGGAGLPAVTTDDNGKVLGVVNGAWDKTDAPEGTLPEVTSEDEGKVLTVEDGEWKAEYPLEPPVYDNDYKVTLTATLDEQTQQVVLTADKTVAEIYAAAVADKNCFAVVELAPGTYQRYELYHYSALQVTFYGVEMDEEGGASIAKPIVIEGAATTGHGYDEWTVID